MSQIKESCINTSSVLFSECGLNENIESANKSTLETSIDFTICRYIVFCICLTMWLILWYQKTALGKQVFGYKGDNKFLKFRRQIAIYSWWWQCPLIFLALTYHNNIIIDSITIFCTLTFGGGWYYDYKRIPSFIYLNNPKWNGYVCSLIFELSHHAGVSYCILFESDENKLLYRPVFVWAWFAHLLGSLTRKYSLILKKYAIESDYVWQAYWKTGPYVYLYWYLFGFMKSDNTYLSAGAMLWFGRWIISFEWPTQKNWQSESYNTVFSIGSVYIYQNCLLRFDISWSISVMFVFLTAYLQQKSLKTEKVELPKSDFIKDGFYKFKNELTQKFIDIETGNLKAGAKLIQWDEYHSSESQIFYVKRQKDGEYYTVKCKHSEKYWDVNAASTHDGAKVIQYEFHGGENQLFAFEKQENDSFKIIAKCSNKALSVKDASKENGAEIVQSKKENQYFQLISKH